MNQHILWENISVLESKINYSKKDLQDICRYKKALIWHKIIIKGAKPRIIHIPQGDYIQALRRIDRQLKQYKLPFYIYGTRKGVSAIDSAKVHIKSDFIFKLDLKSYYDNTNYHRIRNTISRLTPDKNIIDLLTPLCTYNYTLPLGFPTSPSLSELTVLPLANELRELCDKHSFLLSIYIDDICISGSAALSEMRAKIISIFKKRRFKLNYGSEKMQFKKNAEGIVITGVLIKNYKTYPKPGFEELLGQLIDEYIQYSHYCSFDKFLEKQLQKINGRIGWLKQIDPVIAEKFLHQLLSRESKIIIDNELSDYNQVK
jgi:RNA-directed DNA polymerase